MSSSAPPSGSAGYDYYADVQLELQYGPVDSVTRFIYGEREAWSGEQTESGDINVNAPELFGGSTREGGPVGTLTITMGDSVVPDPYLESVIAPKIPAYIGAVTAIFKGFLWSSVNPYFKAPWLETRRILKGWKDDTPWYPEKATIRNVGIGVGEVTQHVNFDAKGDGINGSFRYQGVTVAADPAEVLKVRKLAVADGGLYEAWRIGGSYNWKTTTYVRKGPGGPISVYLDVGGATAAAAEAAGIAAGEFTLTGYSEYTFCVYDDLYVDNQGGLSLLITRSRAVDDMNPAHIIYQILTDTQWGMGYNALDIDDDNFRAAADTFFDEGFGLSFIWDQPMTIEKILEVILETVGATLELDLPTGKFQLQLIRDDYDVDDLLVLDPSNIISLESFQRAAWGELNNYLTVKYTDRNQNEDAVSVSSLDSINGQGGVLPAVKEYLMVREPALALRLAQRDLNTCSSPLAKIQLVTNRVAYKLRTGQVFAWTWPDLGIIKAPFRITSISRGDLSDGKISIEAVEDVFGLPDTVYTGVQLNQWQDPLQEPVPPLYPKAIEAPYWDIARNLSAADLNALNPGYAFGATVAGEPEGLTFGYDLYGSDSIIGYERVGTGTFTPIGKLASGIDHTETTISLEDFQDLAYAEVGGYAIIGSEYVSVILLNPTAGTAVIGRGVLDTLPKRHPAGTLVYFAQGNAGADLTEHSAGITRHYKVLTRTSLGTLSTTAAPDLPVTFIGRAERPYPPGNLKVNGSYYPASFAGNLNLTWAHRDRIAQTVDLVPWTSGNIGPEAGTTYNLRIYDQNNDLLRTESLAGNSYEYTSEMEEADSGGSGTGVRVEKYWSKTSLLLNFNGANNSTTFIDSSGNFAEVMGTPTVDTAVYKYAPSSGKFSGNNQLITTTHPDYAIGTGDFTIEFWVRRKGDGATGSGNAQLLFDMRTAAPSVQILMYIESAANSYALTLEVNGTIRIQGGAATLNTWVHVALVRSAGSTKLYVNGSQVGSSYSDSNNYTATKASIMGRFASIGGDYRAVNGNIQDLRVTKAARYTGTFTPPTNVLGKYVKDATWSDNVLALNFEGENNSVDIKDQSDSKKPISIFGNAKLSTAQSKFGASSLELDGGSTSFISAPFSTVYSGTSNFTLECWVRTSDVTRSGTIACTTTLSSGSRAGWCLSMTNTSRLFVEGWDDSSATALSIFPSTTLSADTWYHVALVRNGSTWTLYLNGTSIGSATESAAIGVSGDGLYIGRDQWTLITWLGHIDDFRVRPGAKYTSNFTAPATSFLPIDPLWANVVMLLNFNGDDGSTDFENVAELVRTLTVAGNSKISTSQFKYGGASAVFDGAGDYASIADTSRVALGSSNFTIEFWMRPSGNLKSYAGSAYAGLICKDSSASRGWGVIVSGSTSAITNLAFTGYSNNSTNIAVTVAHAFSLNTWYHVAVVRDGNVVFIYIDGVLKNVGGTTFNLTIQNSTATTKIGAAMFDATYLGEFTGNVDDLRVTLAARYTASFTPPSAELSKLVTGLNSQLRIELESKRDGLVSMEKYDLLLARA